MAAHVIKKGLDLPIAGAPGHDIDTGKKVERTAITAIDHVGMKPTFRVKEGDTVKRGQVLFEDKKNPGVLYTAPSAGTVTAIHRGERRMLLSAVITLSDGERNGQPGDGEHVSFEAYAGKAPAEMDEAAVRALLLESGEWTAFRTRPFSKAPAADAKPHAIFVTAMDSNPLAAPIGKVAEGRDEDLEAGLEAIRKLTNGKVYFCKAAGSSLSPGGVQGITVEEFSGPHPSGLAGTHIHILEPVSLEKIVWTIGLHDVIAIGALFRTGRVDVVRIISLAGPGVKNPRLIKTRRGASTIELCEGELLEGEQRIVAGSVLSGRSAGDEVTAYLSRFHTQISVLSEGREREFLGWLAPGGNKFSVINTFISRFSPGKKFAFTTTTNGSARAMVPIGMFEKVMPLDILPSYLLRSLIVDDLERARELGCLELDEEDLALCTFVCPGKYEYGPILRRNLTQIENEG